MKEKDGKQMEGDFNIELQFFGEGVVIVHPSLSRWTVQYNVIYIHNTHTKKVLSQKAFLKHMERYENTCCVSTAVTVCEFWHYLYEWYELDSKK